MSDIPQGPGWWQASDGRWYPPSAAPGAEPPPAPRPPGPPPQNQWAPPPGPGAQGAPPHMPPGAPGGPPGPPPGPGPQPQPWAQPGGGYGYGPGPQRQNNSNKALWIVLGVIGAFLVLVVGGCFALTVVIGNAADNAIDSLNDLAIDFTGAEISDEPASCTVTGLDFADDYEVDATITNESGFRASYRISYDLFDQQGTRLGSDSATIGSVQPSDTQTADDITFISGSSGPDPGDVRCEVNTVERVPAP